jgi:hypothetical protein
MSDPMSFAELEAQHVALLPARTVLSLLSAGPADGADGGDQAGQNGAPGHPGEPGQSIQGSGRTITYDHVDQFGDSTSH